MKFTKDRPFANLIANAMEADHAGRVHIGTISREFLNAGGSVGEYGAAMKAAVDRGLSAAPVGRLSVVHPSRRGFGCVMESFEGPFGYLVRYPGGLHFPRRHLLG